jgi:hypothetical protein
MECRAYSNNDILILINVGQKLKTNAQYIFYLHIFHQRLPNMVKRLFADVIHDAIVLLEEVMDVRQPCSGY